jgi:Type IV secretion system pilin
MKKYRLIWLRQVAPSAITVVVGFLVSSFAQAQTNSNGLVTAPTNIITSPSSVVQLFCTVLGWMFWALIVLGVAMFIVGGYRYATSGGEAERVSKATKTLTYAAIALVVGLIAGGIPSLISSFLGNGALNACSPQANGGMLI